MAMPQEQLLAAEYMPRRAQENLPVMPNNGNPRTIYNMPGTGGNAPAQQAAARCTKPLSETKSPYFYPWMAPSPSVDRIRQMIKPQTHRSCSATAAPCVEQPHPSCQLAQLLSCRCVGCTNGMDCTERPQHGRRTSAS